MSKRKEIPKIRDSWPRPWLGLNPRVPMTSTCHLEGYKVGRRAHKFSLHNSGSFLRLRDCLANTFFSFLLPTPCVFVCEQDSWKFFQRLFFSHVTLSPSCHPIAVKGALFVKFVLAVDRWCTVIFFLPYLGSTTSDSLSAAIFISIIKEKIWGSIHKQRNSRALSFRKLSG